MTKFRPAVEALEDRLALTTTQLVLDFTPTGGVAFTQLFRRNPHATRLLDVNHDGRVTLKDAALAARAITHRLSVLFTPFASLNLTVRYGDVGGDSQLGKTLLDAAWNDDSREVAVLYVSGGKNPYGNAVKGEAPLAPDVANVEGSGRVFGANILQALQANRRATTQTLVGTFAAVAAHEFGHMMGLRHSLAFPNINLMNPVVSANAPTRRFINATVPTQGGANQNAVAELVRSFQGQSTVH